MALYGSTEWLNQFQDVINQNEDFRKASQKHNASNLVITDMDGLPKPAYVWMDIYDGKMREWSYLVNGNEKKADFTLTGDYYAWKAICKGELDVIKAVLTGKIKLKGNKLKLLKQQKSSMALLNVMKSLKTEFPDDIFEGK